jgi:hypothetical protein
MKSKAAIYETNKIKYFLLFTVLISLISGCASSGKNTLAATQSQEEAVAVKRIALVPIQEPSLYSIKVQDYNLVNPGVTLVGRLVGFGMEAALVGTDQASKNHRLTSTLHNQGFNVSDQLKDDLVKRLKQIGYDVVVLDGITVRKHALFEGWKLVGDVPKLDKPVDAYLYVQPEFVGYSTLARGQALVPTVDVAVRLVSAQSHNLLYAANMRYGGITPVSSSLDMPADPKYSLSEFPRTSESQALAAAGMKAATDGIANLVAQNFQ